MTTVDNNLITITAPCTGIVEYAGPGEIYIVDNLGCMRYILATDWTTNLAPEGLIVIKGDVIGTAQLEVLGEVDQGMVQTEHAVNTCAGIIAEHLVIPITYTMDIDCYNVNVGAFNIRAEYGEHCTITAPNKESWLVSDITGVARGLYHYTETGKFAVL